MSAHDSGPVLWLIRHGETEWSKTGQHTGRSDLPLTEHGYEQALGLRALLQEVPFSAVITSPRIRAQKTCELAGCADRSGITPIVDEDLAEWDYGRYEGITSAQIREKEPSWFLWTDGAPGGESPEEMCARVDRLIARYSAQSGNVALFGHGHVLRVIALRWLGWPLEQGAQLGLDTATIGRLNTSSGRRSLVSWNARG